MTDLADAEFAPRYPWDEWFDGQVRKAQRGVDFQVTAANFRYTIKAAAKRRNLVVRTKVRGDDVTFQAVKPAPEPAQEAES